MKLPVLSGTEVVKKLKQIGFVATRQKGSHVRLEKSLPQETVKITVPLHSQKRHPLPHHQGCRADPRRISEIEITNSKVAPLVLSGGMISAGLMGVVIVDVLWV